MANLEHVVGEFHQAGYIHGNLQICNIIVDGEGEGKVKIIDFD
jgi:tRNA A-37 threonylcarbamoyl transferase component Bud32